MERDPFWSVELGVGMGPLVFGAEYESVLQTLRDQRIDVDRLRLDPHGKWSVQEIQTQFVFTRSSPRTLDRIDVGDERLRFGPLKVIGKRAHEIIGMFKISRKETLWASLDPNAALSDSVGESDSTAQNRALLARGTLWLPSLGLGLTLRDGLVATVHLCDPELAPRNGTGSWTKEQQRLSEVREVPADSAVGPNRRHRKFLLNSLIHLIFVASMGTLIWQAVLLQQKWDAAATVPAVVVALDPPPPYPLPEKITVRFLDLNGGEHRPTLGHMQFDRALKMGDEVPVRYLAASPDNVLGPLAARSVGLDTALPYGVGIIAFYAITQLILVGTFRAKFF